MPDGWPRCLACSLQEIALHRFPDGEMRVTVGRAAPTTIIYASLDQPNDKLIAIVFAAEALRRAGAKRLVLLAPYLCYMRQDTAFHEGEAISQRAVGRLIAATVDRVITVDAHLHRTTDIRAVFPGIEAENLSAMPAIAKHCAGRDRPRNDRGRPRRGVPALGERSRRPTRAGTCGCAEDSPRRSLRRNRICRPGIVRRPAGVAGRRYRLLRRNLDGLRQGAHGRRRHRDRRRHHPRLFPPEMATEFANAGIRSIRSTSSVPHPTNAIPLDDLFAAALRREINGASFRETAT